MAITNITQKTNLPIHDSKYSELSVDDKQRLFFSNYYTQVDSVDPALFDLVRGFLVGKNFDESKTKNIANGITTQAEIKIIFGKPFKTGIQNGQPVCVYEYNRYYLIDNDVSKDLIVVFSPMGVVQSHQFMTNEPTP